jgi:biopolymer transport protein ExbB/TolQ
MGILTLTLLSLIVVFVMSIIKKGDEKQLNHSIQWMKSIGTLGLVVGVLGQLIGLFGALSSIEMSQGISPVILLVGLKVSLITTLYGLLIYIIHLLCSMILKRIQ